jgi:DNA-directed RNA polymerase subunit F
MSIFEIILASIGGTAVLFTAVGWLVKSIISQFLEKDLERFKADLARSAYEHQITFGKLHEKRAEIIADLYAKIVALQNSVEVFVRNVIGVTPKKNEENLKTIWKAADSFKDCYRKNKIYFSEDVCELIEDLNTNLSSPVSELSMHLEMLGNSDQIELVYQAWEKAEQKISDKAEIIRREIETEFRKILGGNQKVNS